MGSSCLLPFSTIYNFTTCFKTLYYSNPKSIERMFVPCSLLPAPCSLFR
ncbi:MAG: hypothetical protein F6J94_22385 [Moorea sp. SIO1F2]|nr:MULTISPECIES: hypothetical protein [unclassified Moorena]NEO02739.1 hypothetical protein [Moorena sp. SIO3I7]NEO67098.1 hypothetical protein [Moorena sp. SIO4G2]NEO05945.1 hypothetical protein [Moorena sp. SIO3I8]NEO23697.1 hypothetical protein [Moorena sp. SIO4A5]NEQ61304.1 hypothetical protein [Moorena sp. SIO4A1]